MQIVYRLGKSMNITGSHDRQCYYRIMRSAKNIGSQTSELKGGNEDQQGENKFLKVFWIANNIAAPYPACLKSSALQRDPLELFLPLLQAKVGWEMQELKAVTWTSEDGFFWFYHDYAHSGRGCGSVQVSQFLDSLESPCNLNK